MSYFLFKPNNHIYSPIKQRIYDYIYYTHRGVLLYLKQNNLTYQSTGKNITGKILIKEKYERYIIA